MPRASPCPQATLKLRVRSPLPRRAELPDQLGVNGEPFGNGEERPVDPLDPSSTETPVSRWSSSWSTAL